MSRTALWIVTLVTLSVVSAACSRSENKVPVSPANQTAESPQASQADEPPADVVTANASQVELTSGGKAEGSVTVTIAKGYHINGNPSSKFQIPTTLEMDPVDGISSGKATYPPAISKKFSFSPDPITVYEGAVVIKQPLQASAAVAKGNRSLRARLRVQPCDDVVCYPPRTLPVTIPVNIK